MRSTSAVERVAGLTAAESERAAVALVSADAEVAARLAQHLERQLSAEPLDRFERVWQLSASQAAAVFGVSRQAYAKWHTGGIPPDRRVDVRLADEATAQLLAFVKVDRIPAVVRRPSPSLGGRSLLDVARAHDLAAVRDEVEAVFDLRRVQP
ncbi:MAG TPA: hypothetical protein VND44_05640 [Acidimicrobiales bacterium]|nr:hypothetical protein [Acidimicrobiales bacterium]